MILRNGFRSAFSTWRDRLLLAAMFALMGAWLLNGSRPPLVDWRLATALPLGVAALAQVRISRALDSFVALSPLAPDALERPSQLAYGAVWHAPSFAGAFLVLRLVAPARLASALPAYLCGAILPLLWVALVRRLPMPAMPRWATASASAMSYSEGQRGLAWTVARWQVGHGQPVAATLLLLSMVAVAVALIELVASPRIASASLTFAALAIVWRVSRVDHSTVGFAAHAGYGSAASVGAHAVAPALVGIVLIVLALPTGGVPLSLASAAIVAIALMILTLRVFAYRLYPRRQADLLLTGLGVATALILSAAPILLPPLLIGAAATLGGRSRAATWLSR